MRTATAAVLAALVLGGAGLGPGRAGAQAVDGAAEKKMVEEAAAAGIGGLGLETCANLVGAENSPRLAEATDWTLGYMAGRLDAGEKLVKDEPLAASDSTDIATALLLHCRNAPDATVLAAARAYGERVFGTEPELRQFEAAPIEVIHPKPRPEDLVPAPGEDEAGDGPKPKPETAGDDAAAPAADAEDATPPDGETPKEAASGDAAPAPQDGN